MRIAIFPFGGTGGGGEGEKTGRGREVGWNARGTARPPGKMLRSFPGNEGSETVMRGPLWARRRRTASCR